MTLEEIENEVQSAADLCVGLEKEDSDLRIFNMAVAKADRTAFDLNTAEINLQAKVRGFNDLVELEIHKDAEFLGELSDHLTRIKILRAENMDALAIIEAFEDRVEQACETGEEA